MNIFEDVEGKVKTINVADGLLGKEVIDGTGKLVGNVKDVVWNFKSNEVESLVVEESGVSFLSRIRSGENRSFPTNACIP